MPYRSSVAWTFAANVHQFGSAGLHAVRHFVGVDARGDLFVAGLDQTLQIQLAHGIDHLALLGLADRRRRGEIDDRIALIAQRHALIRGGQQAAAPEHRAAAGATRAALQHDEAWQVAALAAQAIRDPGTHAGPAKQAAAGVHEQLGGRMVEQIRLAGAHDADLVHDARDVRQQVADPRPAPAVLLERTLAGQQIHAMTAVHESKTFARRVAVRDGLAVQLGEFRLVLEKLELRRPARHEQEDDAFRLSGEMRGLRLQRIAHRRNRRCQSALRQERGERDRADANGATAEEMPASYYCRGSRWRRTGRICRDSGLPLVALHL